MPFDRGRRLKFLEAHNGVRIALLLASVFLMPSCGAEDDVVSASQDIVSEGSSTGSEIWSISVPLLMALVVLLSIQLDRGDDAVGFQGVFVEDFSAGLGNWIISSPSVTLDAIGRSPAMLAVAQAGVPAEANSAATFFVWPGLDVLVDVSVAGSVGEIRIVDNAVPAVRDTYVLITDNSALFSIQGVTKKVPFAPDSHVHRYLFHTQDGLALWARDGTTFLRAPYDASKVFIALRDLVSGSSFDLVHISTSIGADQLCPDAQAPL